MQSKKDKPPHINVDYFEDLTGEIESSQGREVQDLGEKVRQLRQEQGLELSDLARVTGYEEAFLASIEKGEVQPQLGTVIRLSKALAGDLGTLISGEGDKAYAITRSQERKSVARSTSSQDKQELYAYMSLAPEVRGRHMEPLVVRLRQNPDEETSVHEGEEFIFVLEGEVLVRLGEDRFELKPGDSVYYQSTQPHMLAAKEDSATILAVIYEGQKKE
ncbi:MAG: helix-turn-helix domain-containing protein [Desulfohalobiaceae bacterium]